MKKILFTMFLMLNAVCAFSQNYTKEQEKLRTEISEFLRKEGLNPEYQNDGLKFKSEGDTYYIEIDKNSKEPMYISLRRYIKYDDRLDKNKISKNLKDYNLFYCVKVFCLEKSFVLSSEMFISKSSEFTYAFNTFLSQIKSAYKEINN